MKHEFEAIPDPERNMAAAASDALRGAGREVDRVTTSSGRGDVYVEADGVGGEAVVLFYELGKKRLDVTTKGFGVGGKAVGETAVAALRLLESPGKAAPLDDISTR